MISQKSETHAHKFNTPKVNSQVKIIIFLISLFLQMEAIDGNLPLTPPWTELLVHCKFTLKSTLQAPTLGCQIAPTTGN